MLGFGKKKPKDEQPGRATIVPRIKHVNFQAALRDMQIPADQLPVTEPFVADLVITYAFDLPGMFQMASEVDLKRLSLNPGEFRELAINNLRKEVTSLEFKGQPPLLMLTTGNDLEACTLLLPEIWNRLATQVPGHLVVGVPCRNLVLISSSDSKDGLKLMGEVVDEAYQQEQVHCLTRKFLTWRDGAWESVGDSLG